MVLILNEKHIASFYKAELLYELHKATECNKLFIVKYCKNFKDFEKELKKISEEDVEMWDDYLEWKACLKTIEFVKKKLKFISEYIEKNKDNLQR